jgi:hypothetical protein
LSYTGVVVVVPVNREKRIFVVWNRERSQVVLLVSLYLAWDERRRKEEEEGGREGYKEESASLVLSSHFP